MCKSSIADVNESGEEANILSFIVRVWMEKSVSEAQETIWRGHITPVPDGERHYFSNINDIPAFIVAHWKAQQ